MIEGKKLLNKVKALKMKYCKYCDERPDGDTFSGAQGFIEMMLTEAIKYGYEQGESFGRYEKYAEQVTDKFLIQPENDRAWKEELDEIMKDCRNITCRSNESKVYKQRKKFEKLLQKMLDKKIIKSWFYNGGYHITFNEVH